MSKKQASKQAASKKTSSRSASAEPAKAPAAAGGAGGIARFEDFDKLFDDFLNRRWPSAFRGWPAWRELSEGIGQRIPSVDVVDGDTEIVVRAEVPGIERKDLEVSIVDRTLTIKGKSRREKKEEKKDYFRQEIRSGQFSRSVQLPADVDAEKSAASYKDGVVELRLPKVGGVSKRKIPLS